jgi:hypothetical protein
MPTTACWICHQQEAQRGKAAINHTLDHTGSFTDAQLHDWCQLVNGGLYLLAAWLKCDSLDDLLRHVLGRSTFQDRRDRNGSSWISTQIVVSSLILTVPLTCLKRSGLPQYQDMLLIPVPPVWLHL